MAAADPTTIRFDTAEQKAAVSKFAASCGMSLTQYVKQMALAGAGVGVLPAALRARKAAQGMRRK